MRLPASTTIKLRAAASTGGAVGCHAAAQPVHPGATGTSGGGDLRPAAEARAGLAELAYELLDAHSDTAQLIAGLPHDPCWAAHLDYLRALQRTGRAMLARTAVEELSPCRRDDVGSLDVR
jgi:hypothetical protein